MKLRFTCVLEIPIQDQIEAARKNPERFAEKALYYGDVSTEEDED